MFKKGDKVIYKPSGRIGIITNIENDENTKRHGWTDDMITVTLHPYVSVICTTKSNLSLLRESKLRRLLG